MSYAGSRFPEGIDPELYDEIFSVKDVTCTLFRRTVVSALSAKDTTAYTCDGCGTTKALIVVVDLETERIFVRKNSPCTGI